MRRRTRFHTWKTAFGGPHAKTRRTMPSPAAPVRCARPGMTIRSASTVKDEACPAIWLAAVPFSRADVRLAMACWDCRSPSGRENTRDNGFLFSSVAAPSGKWRIADHQIGDRTLDDASGRRLPPLSVLLLWRRTIGFRELPASPESRARSSSMSPCPISECATASARTSPTGTSPQELPQ